MSLTEVPATQSTQSCQKCQSLTYYTSQDKKLPPGFQYQGLLFNKPELKKLGGKMHFFYLSDQPDSVCVHNSLASSIFDTGQSQQYCSSDLNHNTGL